MSTYYPPPQTSSFTSKKFVSYCTDESATIIGLKPVNRLVSIYGGPYLFAVAAGNSLFTVVAGETKPFLSNFVLIYQISTGSFTKSLEFDTDILALSASDTHLFVSMAKAIQVVEISSLRVIHTIERSSATGIIATCSNALVYTCDDAPGVVMLADVPGFSILQQINCHQDPIHCLSISPDGKFLATASEKGTLVRVFDVQQGEKSGEFRRGYRGSSVLGVDSDGTVTCACTSTTLHVFTKCHITLPLTQAPLAMNLIDGDLWIVTADGILSIYKVDCAAGKLTIQNQQKLSELSVTEHSPKRAQI